MHLRVEVASTGKVLAEKATRTKTLRERMRGLLGRPPLLSGEALLIEPAAQVHTIGMRYPIDVVFCDKDGTILHVVRNMRPHRVTRWVRRARVAIEMAAGSLPDDVRPGDRINF